MESRRGRTQSIAVIASLIAGVVAMNSIGCGGDDASTSEASAPVCKQVDAPKPTPRHGYNAPEFIVKKDEDLVALVETNCGRFQIALDTKRAQKTVSSFAALAKKGFYEGFAFDRLEPGLRIQGGDPLASGPGYSVDEKPPPGTAYTRGVVAMAKRPNDPPGRSRSEFFIVLAADAGLPPEYALIGKVDEGLDVVERISDLGTPSGKPKQDVVIDWIWAKKRNRKVLTYSE